MNRNISIKFRTVGSPRAITNLQTTPPPPLNFPSTSSLQLYAIQSLSGPEDNRGSVFQLLSLSVPVPFVLCRKFGLIFAGSVIVFILICIGLDPTNSGRAGPEIFYVFFFL